MKEHNLYNEFLIFSSVAGVAIGAVAGHIIHYKIPKLADNFIKYTEELPLEAGPRFSRGYTIGTFGTLGGLIGAIIGSRPSHNAEKEKGVAR